MPVSPVRIWLWEEETPSQLQEAVADQVKVVFQGKVNKSFGRPQLILINLHPLFELWVLTSLQCHQIDFPSKPLVETSVNNKSSSSGKTQGWLKENACPTKGVCSKFAEWHIDPESPSPQLMLRRQHGCGVLHWSWVSKTPADAQEKNARALESFPGVEAWGRCLLLSLT